MKDAGDGRIVGLNSAQAQYACSILVRIYIKKPPALIHSAHTWVILFSQAQGGGSPSGTRATSTGLIRKPRSQHGGDAVGPDHALLFQGRVRPLHQRLPLVPADQAAQLSLCGRRVEPELDSLKRRRGLA